MTVRLASSFIVIQLIQTCSLAPQFCVDCEAVITNPDGNRPLPRNYRLLLRATLPLPDDDDISSIASSEDDDDMKQLRKQVVSIRDQQVGQARQLEDRINRLESKVDGIEGKLDLILHLLASDQDRHRKRDFSPSQVQNSGSPSPQ